MTRVADRYAKLPGGQPRYRIEAVRALLAERDYAFSLYDADVTTPGGFRARHLLVVPVAVSAVSFSVGLALLEEDSRRVDAGDWNGLAALASAIQGNYRRYRVFPANELGRFIL